MVSLLSFAAAAFASDVVQGAHTAGMGGVGVASANDNAGITLNPGLIGLVERYDVHAHVRFGPTGDLQWAATALDARTSDVFGAGFAYSGDRFDPPLRNSDLPGWSLPDEELSNHRRQDDYTLAFGLPVLDRRASIGLGVLFSRFTHDLHGKGSTADLHAGIGVRPADWVTVGIGLRNFVQVDSPQDRPISAVAGGRLEAGGRFAVEANLWWTADPLAASKESFAIGAEVSPAETLRVRLGASRDGAFAQNRLTFGLGLVGKSGGGIDYALLVPLPGEPLQFRSLVHQIAFRFRAPEDLLESDR